MVYRDSGEAGAKLFQHVYDKVSKNEKAVSAVGATVGPLVNLAASAATGHPAAGNLASAAAGAALESNPELKRGVAGTVAGVAAVGAFSVAVSAASILLAPLTPLIFLGMWLAFKNDKE